MANLVWTMAITERHAQRLERTAARPDERVPAVIEFKNVTKTFESGDVGLKEATFSIRRGEFVFLVGQTGSGKSTLMRLIIKEHEATTGSIHVAGRDLTDIDH